MIRPWSALKSLRHLFFIIIRWFDPDEGVAYRMKCLIGGIAISATNHIATIFMKLLGQSRKSTIAGNDDEGVNRRARMGKVNGINGQLNVGRVLAGIPRKPEHLHGINPKFIDLVAKDSEARVTPIGVCPLNRDPTYQIRGDNVSQNFL